MLRRRQPEPPPAPPAQPEASPRERRIRELAQYVAVEADPGYQDTEWLKEEIAASGQGVLEAMDRAGLLAVGYKMAPVTGMGVPEVDWSQADITFPSRPGPASQQQRMTLARQQVLDAAGTAAVTLPNALIVYGPWVSHLLGDGKVGTI